MATFRLDPWGSETYRSVPSATVELLPGQLRAGGQCSDLLVAHVAWAPAEPTVWVDPEFFRLDVLQRPVDPLCDVFRGVGVEVLDVDQAGPELAVVAEPLADLFDLGQLTARELQHELVRVRLAGAGEVVAVDPLEAAPPDAVAEADVERQFGVDALGRLVEEAGHLLAGDVAARRLVDLDELRAGGDEPLQLLVDDLEESLGDVDGALVLRSRVDARAERQRPGTGRLEGLVGVGHRVLELVDDPEAALRDADFARRDVARLLVVPPGAVLALDLDRLDVLDDGVVRVDVAVEAPDLAVSDDVEPGLRHVADRRVGRVVEHLG